jgi:hypothetical protein
LDQTGFVGAPVMDAILRAWGLNYAKPFTITVHYDEAGHPSAKRDIDGETLVGLMADA